MPTRPILLLLTLLLAPALAADQTQLPEYPQVLIETSEGDIVLELERRRAPRTVAAFVKLVESGYFEGTIFHRVIDGFVAQAGGYYRDYSSAPDAPAIVNESGNGLSNQRGTVAMARTDDPHSANAQFYINLDDNSRLDPRPDRWGYTVFGRVYSGMDVIDAIAALPTGPAGPFPQDVPAVAVVIRKVSVLSDEDIAARAQAELEAARKELEALDQP